MLSLSCVRAAIVCVCVCVAVCVCCCVAVFLCCFVSLIFKKNAVVPPPKKCGFIFFCYSLTYMKGGGFPSFEKRAARRNQRERANAL